MKLKPRVFLITFWVVVFVHLLAILLKNPILVKSSKPLLLIALAAYAWFSLPDGRLRLFIIAALAASWLGDVFLIFDGEFFFIAGLLSFLAAHVVYVWLYTKVVSDQKPVSWTFKAVIGILLLAYGVFLFSKIYQGLGELVVPVMIYSIVLLSMALFAFSRLGRTNWASFTRVVFGALFFIISDSLLAYAKFGETDKRYSLLIMLTYILAQYWIVRGFIKHFSESANQVDRFEVASKCPNCQTTLQGKFCYSCGQKIREERLSIGYLFEDFVSNVFNLERGAFYTSKQLLLKPEMVIDDYLKGRTIVYTNPFKYLFFTATISAILSSFVNYELVIPSMASSSSPQVEEATKQAFTIMQQYWTLLTMAFAPIFAICTYFVYKKDKLNYSEHLIISSFTSAQMAILGLPLTLLMVLFPELTSAFFTISILGFGYLLYAFYNIFNVKGIKAIVKFIIIIVMFMVLTGILANVYGVVYLMNHLPAK